MCCVVGFIVCFWHFLYPMLPALSILHPLVTLCSLHVTMLKSTYCFSHCLSLFFLSLTVSLCLSLCEPISGCQSPFCCTFVLCFVCCFVYVFVSFVCLCVCACVFEWMFISEHACLWMHKHTIELHFPPRFAIPEYMRFSEVLFLDCSGYQGKNHELWKSLDML